MSFLSTGGRAPIATLSESLFRGLAPDGGLYIPNALPARGKEWVEKAAELPWPDSAVAVAQHFLSQTLDRVALEGVVREALNFPIPLVPLAEGIFVLELFRGPTLAFKDIGARFMARLMAHFRAGAIEPLTVLTATSGDTGGAVAHAFFGLPGVRIVILFPDGKVTPRQERQFSTLGGNVEAVAVQGDFDDCQRLAKAAFSDEELRSRLSLTSANSINVGRFLPQSFYYVHALGEVRRTLAAGPGVQPPLLFSVPSGNFGNVAAGLLAKAFGLDARFLAATNANDEVPEFLRTGTFAPQSSIPTLSTAMDVGDPSNLDRILHLYRGSLDRLREDLVARSVTDAETRATIKEVHGATGYILDPHSAVGYAALESELESRPGTIGVLLATAHPAKFAEVVEPILGETLPLPPELARVMAGERKVTPMEAELEALKKFLLEGS